MSSGLPSPPVDGADSADSADTDTADTPSRISGRRHPANTGGPVDAESGWAVAQAKHVRRLSLAALEALALEAERQGAERAKVGLVIVKRPAGRGVETPRLVVVTEAVWRELTGALPGRHRRGRVGRRGASVSPTPVPSLDDLAADSGRVAEPATR